MPIVNQVAIVNRALAGIGCTQIQSFASPGPAGSGPQKTFERVLDDLVSKYPWHFAHGFGELTRLTGAPVAGWKYAFQLPSDRIGPPRALYDSQAETARPLTRFQMSEGTVLASVERIWAFYPRLPDPSLWPGYFQELVILCCQAEYALAIREDPALRDRLRRDAYGPPEYQGQGGQFAVAALLDAQSNPSQQVADGYNPLTSFRTSGFSAEDARAGFEDW